MQHVAHRQSDEIHQLRAENEQLRMLLRCALLDNDRDDAADGVTVLEVWRKEARRVLNIEAQPNSEINRLRVENDVLGRK